MTSPILVAAEPSVAPRSIIKPSRSDYVVFYGIIGLVLFGPLAFGAVEAWSIFILEFATSLLFLFWIVRHIESSYLGVIRNPLFLPMFVFAGLILVQLATGRSAYRYETSSKALLYCAYGMLCFLVVQCVRRASQAKKLALILSIYGFSVALFALIQSLAPNGKIYWLREAHLGGWIYGPYVNHNHYAGLMEMLVPIPLVFCFTRYAYGVRRTIAGVGAAVMASTVFLSGSRGGMLALAFEMTFFSAVLMTRRKRSKAIIVGGVFLLIVFGLLTWVGGGELANRMASIRTEAKAEMSGGMRLAIDRDSLHMFLKKPVLGWGLGTFPIVYPQFRSFYTNFFVNEAHNDYLQLLVEMGALGFATMLWFLVALYRNSLKKLHDWPININGAVTLAALLGCTGILVHSFVDFNLHVPGNAALFFVLCMLAVSEPLLQSTPRRRSHSTELWASGEAAPANEIKAI